MIVVKINFRQCWLAQKYFVVHVPKTGGTSLFNWLCRIYGMERCREHIESIVLPTPTAEAIDHLMGFDVIGGHVPIDYLMYFTAGDFTPMTIIRNPSDQFFSHVNHILNVDVGEGLLRRIQDNALASPALAWALCAAPDVVAALHDDPVALQDIASVTGRPVPLHSDARLASGTTVIKEQPRG